MRPFDRCNSQADIPVILSSNREYIAFYRRNDKPLCYIRFTARAASIEEAICEVIKQIRLRRPEFLNLFHLAAIIETGVIADMEFAIPAKIKFSPTDFKNKTNHG